MGRWHQVRGFGIGSLEQVSFWGGGSAPAIHSHLKNSFPLTVTLKWKGPLFCVPHDYWNWLTKRLCKASQAFFQLSLEMLEMQFICRSSTALLLASWKTTGFLTVFKGFLLQKTQPTWEAMKVWDWSYLTYKTVFPLWFLQIRSSRPEWIHHLGFVILCFFFFF